MVLAILLLAVIFLFPIMMTTAATGNVTAIVSQDGKEISRIRLTGLEEEVTVRYEGAYPGVILAQDGRIRFEEAACPDHICVNTGWLGKQGQTAACLPARVLIRIEGTATGDEDVRLR